MTPVLRLFNTGLRRDYVGSTGAWRRGSGITALARRFLVRLYAKVGLRRLGNQVATGDSLAGLL